MDRSQKLALIRAHCARPPHAVLFDETGETLFDVRAVKTLPLRADDLVLVSPERDKDSKDAWLRLRYEDGRELGLTAAGIAFAPDFTNSGPQEELPPAVCFADLALLEQRIRHPLELHPEDKPSRDIVRLVMCAIAIVDGARAAGFDVSKEERTVEALLSAVEQRVRG